MHICLLPGHSPSAARGGARGAHAGGPEGGSALPWLSGSAHESPVQTAGGSRCSARDAKALRAQHRPAGGARSRSRAVPPSAPPPVPCTAGAGALGQQTPGTDSPRDHFRVPPPAAAIGQWAARRGCRELCRPRPPAPGQPLPSGFASSAAGPGLGFVLFISLLFSVFFRLFLVFCLIKENFSKQAGHS